MTDVVVVHGQIAKHFLAMGLQLGEQLFERSFVEEAAGRSEPRLVEALFGGGGEAGENQGAEAVSGAFLDVHFVRDSVGIFVVSGNGVELHVEAAAVAVFLAHTVPATFDGHAVGNLPRLKADQAGESEVGERGDASPFDGFPVIHGTGNDRDENGDLLRHLLIGIAGKTHFGRAQLDAQVSAFEINGADLLKEKEINLGARIFGAGDFRDMLANGFVVGESRIAEGDAGDLQASTLEVEFLDVTVADRVGENLMLESSGDAALVDKGCNDGGSIVDYGAGRRELAFIEGKLLADGVVEFAVVEPRKIVVEDGEERGFVESVGQHYAVGFGLEVVVHVREEASLYKAVGSGLQVVAGDFGAGLQGAESDDLIFGEALVAFDANLAKRGALRGGRLREDRVDGRTKKRGEQERTDDERLQPHSEILAEGNRREVITEDEGPGRKADSQGKTPG